jgi:hypothetical protein
VPAGERRGDRRHRIDGDALLSCIGDGVQGPLERNATDRSPVDLDHEGTRQTVDAAVEAAPPIRASVPRQGELVTAAREDLETSADERRAADRRNAENPGQLRRVTPRASRLRGRGALKETASSVTASAKTRAPIAQPPIPFGPTGACGRHTDPVAQVIGTSEGHTP